MKRIKNIKPDAKKLFLNGIVYIALSVTVVAVTIGSIVSSFSEKDSDVIPKSSDNTGHNGDYKLELPESPIHIGDFSLDTPVSDNPSGISAQIMPPSDVTDIAVKTPDVVESIPDTAPTPTPEPSPEKTEATASSDKTKPVYEEPDEAVFEYGYDGFIKPCSGYISKEFSTHVPVYSVSMYDYRTHNGVDIAAEIGTPVKASSNGIITEIYDDYLYGTTVVIEHKDGIRSVYSNLSPDLPAETVEGRAVITGEIIAGIGESASCEAAEAHHLHFEMTKDGKPVNPEEYFVN